MNCRHKTDERGFILIWAIFLLLGILVSGFTFLLYARANITRFKAQYLAMNLVTIGSYSSEFDTDESLNNMALLAELNGFRGIKPIPDVQLFQGGSLIFKHSVGTGTSNEISAHVNLMQKNIIGGLLSNLTGVATNSFSSAKPAPLYLNMTYDYSMSLAGDSIDNLLNGFQIKNLDGTPGPNGQIVGSEVVPKKEIQTALPFAWDPATRILAPWSGVSASWPNILNPSPPPCTPTTESMPCSPYSSYMQPQQESIRLKASDLFMEYKKAVGVLTGAVGRISPYLDIDILCGLFPDSVVSYINTNINLTEFDPIQATGVCPAWRYDEQDYTTYTVANGVVTGTPGASHSIDNPKNIFTEAVVLAPNRILQFFLDLTFSRKLLRYATIYAADGVTPVSLPGQYSKLLEMPLPKLTTPFPVDGFPYNVGALYDTTYYKKILADPLLFFGWPGRPQPMLDNTGSAYPKQVDLPPEIKDPWEYDCNTGPPLNMNYPFNHRPYSPGNFLCHIYKQCNPGAVPAINCSSAAALPPVNAYYNPAMPAQMSPLCPASATPRCYTDPTYATLQPNAAVFCMNNTPRCFGEGGAGVPACTDGSYPGCSAIYNLTTSPPTPPTPSGWSDIPHFRGKVVFPAAQPPQTPGMIIHMLGDLSPFWGGTHTHNAVPIDRCRELKAALPGQESQCAWVLVTDGQPFPVDSAGNFVMSQQAALNQLSNDVNIFVNELGGRIFTWYLGSKVSAYEKLLALITAEEALGTLDPSVVPIVNSYIKQALAIPPPDCPTWDLNKPPGAPDCNSYNNTVLLEHLQNTNTFSQFQGIMSGTDSKIFIQSTVNNTVAGTQLSNEFLAGLRHLLSLTKREVGFRK